MKKLPILSILLTLLMGAALGQFQTGQTTAVVLDSFNTGQVSPKMEARQNFPKYNSACRTLENFLISPLGPVQRRPGTRYIATAKTGTPRLIKFEYSTDDVYAIEMGDSYMRFCRNGGQILDPNNDPYEITTVFDANEIRDVRYAQSDNWMYLVDGNDPPQILTRTGHAAWTITEIDYEKGPFLSQNSSQGTTITPSSTTGAITLVATASIFDSDHVGALWRLTHNVDANSISGTFTTTGRSNPALTNQSGSATAEQLSATLAVSRNQDFNVTAMGYWIGTLYIEKSYDDGSTWGVVYTYSNPHNEGLIYRGTETLDDALYRLRMTDHWGPWYHQDEYYLSFGYTLSTVPYERQGIVKITAVTDANDANATVLYDLGGTTATYKWAEGAWSDYRGWPNTVCFHQQRAIFGGSESYPTQLWFSAQGAEDYNDLSAGVLDTDGFSVAIQGQNPIRWLLSGDYLLIGTSGSVGKFGLQGKSLSPTSPNYLEQSQFGSAAIQALNVADTVMYVERNLRKIREFTYSLNSDRYTSPDLTLLCEEITDPCVVEIAFQSRPQPVLWCVLGDGQLASLSYQKDQSVAGWSKHNTRNWDNSTLGEFNSLIIIPGSGTTPAGDVWLEDQIYCVATRTADGNESVTIEQFTPVDWGDDDDYCWFVDCGLYGLSGGGGDANVYSPTVGEYPTLRALTAEEIPDAPAEPSETAATTAVSNTTELQAVSGTGKYYLTGDIDLTGVSWTPITNFTGVLDGRGYTISNLTINTPASDYKALFGTVGAGVEIYDLTLSGFNITGRDYVSALVSSMNAAGSIILKDITITGCTLTGRDEVAPLAAQIKPNSGNIFGCTSQNCTLTGVQYDCSGLLGQAYLRSTASGDLNIVDCHALNNTIASGYGELCGGLIGYAGGTLNPTPDRYAYFHSCTVSGTMTVATVLGPTSGTGGFVGDAYIAKFVSCNTSMDIIYGPPQYSSAFQAIGGFVGFEDSYTPTYIDCSATGDISIDCTNCEYFQFVGGFGGKWDASLATVAAQAVTRCYATGDITFTNMPTELTWYGIGGFIGGYLSAYNCATGNTIQRCWSEGDITLSHEGYPNVTSKGGLGSFIGEWYHDGTNTSSLTYVIENCYAWGSITVTTRPEIYDLAVSGLIGSVDLDGAYGITLTLLNCYDAQTDTAAGSGYTDQIPTGDYSKGLIGWVEDGMTVTEVNEPSLFWDTQTSGLSTDTYAVGHTTSWMQTQSSYEDNGWNFDTIWQLTETEGSSEPNKWSGFTHGAGGTVCVWADGQSIGTFAVDANGVLDLSDAYDVVIAGLNYDSKLETLPLILPTDAPEARLSDKKLTALSFDLLDSYYLEYALGTGSTPLAKNFADVITDVITFSRMTFPFGSQKKPTLYIETDIPGPLCIRAMIPEVTWYPPK